MAPSIVLSYHPPSVLTHLQTVLALISVVYFLHYICCFAEFIPVCDYFLTLNIVCLQYFLRHEYYSEYLRYSLYIL